MTKRKSEPADLPGEELTALAVSTETSPDEPAELVAPPASSSEEPFELATWRGMPQWRCRRCPWDTLEGEGAVLAHIQEMHVPPPRPPSPPLVAVADRWGREVAPAAAPSESELTSEQERESFPAEEE